MEKVAVQKNEAERFFLEERKNRFIERLKDAIGNTPNTVFAKACGVSEATIRKYLKGASYPDLDVLTAISYVSGRSISWLTGEADEDGTVLDCLPEEASATEPLSIALPPHMDDFIMVNDLSTVEAAAGAGSYVAEEESSGRMAFRREWVEREGLNARALRIIRARGDSMEPTIQDGAPILVEAFTYADDDGNTRYLRNGRTPEEIVRQDGIYVIQLHGRLLVKRLQLDLLGGLLVKSDNQAYDTLHIQANQIEDIAVIGRVVWTGRKL